ncbi:hypothetical protein F5I97DRAFT_1905312 [Phlebopus sp. FC_14]|nr:hypothetical protein F5I97DRAFT_1905312 [Phlebopus sp. FC_14]
MYWCRALSSVLAFSLLLVTYTDVAVAQPPSPSNAGPPSRSAQSGQPPQSAPPQGPPAGQTSAGQGGPPSSGPAPAQPGPSPGSTPAGVPGQGSTGPPAYPYPTGTFVAPTPAASSAAASPSTSISVNLTPFGGSLIPSVPGLSVNVTLSSTAGFPSLTGYPICVSQCLAIAASAANCTSVIAVNCYCSNPLFSGSIVNCTARECIGNLDLSQSLAQQYCNLAQYPAQLSFPDPPPMASSLPPTSITPVTIITGTAPPASRGMKAWDAGKCMLVFGVTFLGAVVGTAMVGYA